jgi:transposase-like protein
VNFEFKSVIELVRKFSTEQICIAHLESLRWNGNVISPFDPQSKVYVCSNNRYRCKNTGKYFNVRTHTLFDNTKVELQSWFVAIYLVTNHKKGISSIQLGKDLNVTQKTAWFMLHRIRNCYGLNDGEMMGGNGETIQLDESFVGGKNKNRHHDKKVEQSQGRSFKDKTPVMGMLQQGHAEIIVRPNKNDPSKLVNEKVTLIPSKVRCQVVQDTKSGSLKPVIYQNVKEGSTLVSDEWHGYRGLSYSYDHRIVDHGRKEYVNANGDTTNAMEGFWTWLKRSYIGIYHFMSRKHLQLYANEMAFRYNTRLYSECERLKFFLSNCNRKLTYKILIAK